MSYIAKLTLENFMRFKGKHTLDLGTGCYAIIAEHLEDADKSNGLGKSSVVAALRLAFEGKKVEDVETLDDYISRGEDFLKVSVELSDGTKFTRARQRGKSTEFYAVVNGKQYQQDSAQDALEAALGISAKDRLTTSWCEQRQLDSLVSASPTELTEMVERWVGDDLKKLAEADDAQNEQLKAASAEHTEAIQYRADLEKIGNDEVVSFREETLGKEKKAFEDSKASFQAALEERQKWAPRTELTEAIKNLNDLKLQLEQLVPKELEEDYDCSDDELKKEFDRLDKVRVSASEAHSSAKREKVRLEALVAGEFDGACPVSKGFKCPAAAQINGRVAENRKAFESAKQDAATKYKTAIDAEKESAELKKGLEARRHLAIENSRIEGKREEIAKRIAGLEASIAKAKAQGTKPLTPGETPPPWPTDPDRWKLTAAEKELDLAVRAKEGLQEANRRVEETAKRLRVCRLAASILGPEGARRRVVERPVAAVAADATAVLEEAGVGQTVVATWGRETGQLATQCYECGSAFPSSAKVKRCESCGAPRGPKITHQFRWKLKFVSGAGKGLGGLGLRIAGFRWLKQNRCATFSTAVLDEITGELDSSRRRAVSASIKKLLAGTFEQAFVVSHHSDGVESCDHRILITGDDNWSKIEVVQ